MNHQVASFEIGVMNGFGSALKKLDGAVAELGKITIHSLTDTFYEHRPGIGDNSHVLVRVVIYSRNEEG